MPTYKVVVYGGDLPGIFAAAKASAELGGAAGNVALIVPSTKSRYKNENGNWVEKNLLGGIMGPGGLNYWDNGNYNGLVEQGSYLAFYSHLGRGFNNVALSDYCVDSMTKRNVTVYYSQDIVSYTTVSSPYRITSVSIKPISRDSTGNVVFTPNGTTTVLNGTVFIDASTGGRLSRRVNTVCTTGRYDWPTQYLFSDEIGGSDFVARQQASTLMFKMRNVAPTESCGFYADEPTKACTLWSPSAPYENPNGPVVAFNNAHKDTDGIVLKPANAARDGQNSDEWWINALLIFNVDGRSHYRDDVSNTVFKVTRKFNYMTTDQAWIKAKNFIKTYKTQIENALRTYEGFSGASIVTDDRGDPVVGDELYIRETVHSVVTPANRANNTENSNYEIKQLQTKDAGSGPPPQGVTTGKDYANYATRIGLGYYNCDIHPYVPANMIKDGKYVWGETMFANIRSDAKNPSYPVYVPFATLVTDYIANLISPGYGAGICSYSWGEMRTIANLSVLGDAAGITAAYCCQNNVSPFNIPRTSGAIAAIQNRIVAYNGRINK